MRIWWRLKDLELKGMYGICRGQTTWWSMLSWHFVFPGFRPPTRREIGHAMRQLRKNADRHARTTLSLTRELRPDIELKLTQE